MNALLAELMDYLREDEESPTLQLVLSAAQGALERAGVITPEDPYAVDASGKELHATYRLAVMMIATHFYEQRTVITPAMIRGESIPLPYGFQYLVLQLKEW